MELTLDRLTAGRYQAPQVLDADGHTGWLELASSGWLATLGANPWPIASCRADAALLFRRGICVGLG